MPAEVRIKIVDESGPAPLTGNGTGGGGGSGTSPPPPPPPAPPGAPDPNDPNPRRPRNRNPKAGDETDAERERPEREARTARGEAWRKRKRREAWTERLNARRKEAEDAKAERELPEREARTARGEAWRKRKRREQRAERLNAKRKEAGESGGGSGRRRGAPKDDSDERRERLNAKRKEAGESGGGSGRRRGAPKDDSDERRERRIRRGEAWRKRKRREQWAERINAKRKEADESRAESATRTARGEAWRKNKRRERLLERRAQKKQLQQSALTAGMTAAGLQGGGLAGAGRGIGGTLGGVAGAALGPVGAIVGQAVGAEVGEAVGNVVRAVTRPFELVGRAAQFAAEGLKKVAADDGFGALMHGAEGVASVMEKIPIVGSALADNFRGLTAVVGAVHGVMEAFAERGKQLGVYSGAISAASARQEVAGQLREMREAQRMGDGYAKLIDKQTEFEASMSGMLMPIKQIIVERLPALIDWFLDNVQGMLERIDNAIPFTTTIFGEMAKEMKKAREEARKLDDKTLEAFWLTFRGGYAPVAYPPMPGALGVPLTVGAAP